MERHDIQQRARAVFERHPQVMCAYLFGSFAEGVARSTSDVDLAVLLDERLDKFKAFELSLNLSDELARRLHRKVDLIILNQTHAALAFQAIRGVLIYDQDPVRRSLCVARIMSRYYDYKRYLAFHWEALSARIREGKCGTVG